MYDYNTEISHTLYSFIFLNKVNVSSYIMTYRILCKSVSLVAYDYFFKSCIRPKVLSSVWYVSYNVVFWTTNNVYIQGIHVIAFHQTLPASNSSKSPHCTLSYYRASKPLANYKSLRFGIIVYGQFFWKFDRYANPLSINIVVGFNHKQRGIARTHARESEHKTFSKMI